MTCAPAVRVAMLRVAVEVVAVAPASAIVPMGTPPDLKVTVPVGWHAHAPASVTVAVKAAVVPSVTEAGKAGAVSAVVVLSLTANAETAAQRKEMQRHRLRSEPPRSVERAMKSPFLDSSSRNARK